jgi:sugar/nucleoside kinase (ribokinase family)
VAAGRASGEVVLIGRVGDDAFGSFLIDWLATERLDATRVTRTSGLMTGCESVAVDRRGE